MIIRDDTYRTDRLHRPPTTPARKARVRERLEACIERLNPDWETMNPPTWEPDFSVEECREPEYWEWLIPIAWLAFLVMLGAALWQAGYVAAWRAMP